MAFGVKVQLGLADGAGASLHKKIQAALNAAGPIKLNKIGVGDKVNIASKIQSALTKQLKSTPVKINNIEVAMNKTVQRNMVRTIQNSLNSADATIKLNKIDASPALAGLKSDITNMLKGLTVGDLKMFLGTDGVNETFLKSAEEQEKALLAAQKKIAAKKSSNVVLDALERQATSSFNAIMGSGRQIADMDVLVSQYTESIAKINELRNADETATAEMVSNAAQQVDAIRQRRIALEAEVQSEKDQAAEAAAKAKAAEKASAAAAKAQAAKDAQDKADAKSAATAKQRMEAQLNTLTALDKRINDLDDGADKTHLQETLNNTLTSLEGIERQTSDVQNDLLKNTEAATKSLTADIERAEKAQTTAATTAERARDAQRASITEISEVKRHIKEAREELTHFADTDVADKLGAELDRASGQLVDAALMEPGKAQDALIKAARDTHKEVAQSITKAGNESSKSIKGLIEDYKDLRRQVEGAPEDKVTEGTRSSQIAEIDKEISALEELQRAHTVVSEAELTSLRDSYNDREANIKQIKRLGDEASRTSKQQEQASKKLTSVQGRLEAFKSSSPEAYARFADDFRRLETDLKMPDLSVDQIAQLNDEIGVFTTRAQSAGITSKGLFDSLADGWKKLGTWTTLMKSFHEIVQVAQKMFSSVVEVDTAMTELKKVTDLTDQAYENFGKTAANSAREIGASLADTVNATADFARLGYDLEESLNLAEAALTYKNVGDGITDISVATESLISTIKAFGIEAEDSMDIVDKFNEVGRLCPAA